MIYRIVFFLFFITLSCKNEKKNKIVTQHNPFEHINQTLENEKAIELFYNAKKEIEKGNLEIASLLLEKSLDFEKNPIILNELGIIFFSEKRFEQALIVLNQSILIDDKYYPSYINKSRVQILQNDLKNAETTLNKMLKKCTSDYWISYANMYLAHITTKKETIDCEKGINYLKKAEILRSEPELIPQLNGISEALKINCG
ncbi:TPR repeat [Maribacter dokdonensis]|uniref:tetratricopeptide repeat protein n=1 Tax=Maribacter dokdonensis TaxID=320912 RepID=UPI001B177431|nr:hypothetical protein [Maribacter dokdonensis]CAG2535290.1 TPR repeat [Maribacter dokdonensis]